MRNKLGVLGYPVTYSLSPKMHTASIESLGYDYTYGIFKVNEEDLEKFVSDVKKADSDVAGFNVTIPYKEKIMPFLDELTDEAKEIGAVNTVAYKDGKLIGHNTDGTGLITYLKENDVDFKGKKILVLGYGGSSKSVISALCKENVIVIDIAARDSMKVIEGVVKLISQGVYSKFLDINNIKDLTEYDVIIQTTPLGMTHIEGELKIPYYFTKPEQVAVDLIYDPKETKFLGEFAKRKCKTFNGLGMLIYQGALSFEFITGKKASIEEMKRVLS